MHVFPYSRRPGTPADRMPDQCSRAVKEGRAHEAQRLCDALFESEEDGVSAGHSDSYMLVKVRGEGLRGTMRDVVITEAGSDALFGRFVELP